MTTAAVRAATSVTGRRACATMPVDSTVPSRPASEHGDGGRRDDEDDKQSDLNLVHPSNPFFMTRVVASVKRWADQSGRHPTPHI